MQKQEQNVKKVVQSLWKNKVKQKMQNAIVVEVVEDVHIHGQINHQVLVVNLIKLKTNVLVQPIQMYA